MSKFFLMLIFFFNYFLIAEVNYRNGNFYLEMPEFVIPTGGRALQVKRIYNSRSTRIGAFGFGWSFNFDVKLKVLPGGKIALLDEDGRKIILAAKNAKQLLEKDLKNFEKASKNPSLLRRVKGMNDHEEMEVLFAKYQVKPEIPNDTVYESYGGWRGYEVLKKTNLGWIRTIGVSGDKQLFNPEGQMVKMLDSNGNFLLFIYKKDSLYQIKNSFNQTVTIQWKNNFITSIRAIDGNIFTYAYDKNRLMEVSHPRLGKHKFEYDKLYNLTKITYPTGDTKELTYDNKHDMVTSEKGPGRVNLKYEYGRNPKDHKHYWTIIKVPFGKTYKEIERWEYWEDKNQQLRIADGSRTITKFSKFGSGSPEFIDRDGRITRFQYNDNGQPKVRILPDGTHIVTEYDKKWGKPEKVTEGKDTYYYSYDKNGNIDTARNNHGLQVKITYDRRGRIRTLHNKKRGTLHFVFNQMGKPTKITQKKVGVIDIKYDVDGKIIKIDAKPDDGKIAQVIITSFHELFGLLRHANI